MLPKVSRTFAINIEALTGELYRAVLSSYLFCRIIDTIEDSHSLDVDTQEELLDEIISIFKTKSFDTKIIRSWGSHFQNMNGRTPEIELIQNAGLVFDTFLSLSGNARDIISHCVIEMAQGMKKTLLRERSAGSKLYTLETISDLEVYCYYVAGTVGVLLTSLFDEYSGRITPRIKKLMQERHVSFGLGLQITNIIKDSFEDHKRGWCYIPVKLAQKYSVPISGLFERSNIDKSMRVFEELIEKAARHLDDALDYTLLIPRSEPRMRLFCLWPLFFAIKTLRAAQGNIALVTGENPVKISRGDVYKTIARTTCLVCSNSLLEKLYKDIRKKI